ncbi:MAG: matrixin family metalloprotease [Deltaproteobacteria bacterium]|nr:MAG: matrixin family metalloprotease [Deltaproteobacteria bacterium]
MRVHSFLVSMSGLGLRCVVVLLGILGCLGSDVSQVQAYVLKRTQSGLPVAWTSMPVSYWVDANGSQSLPDESEAQIVQQAFQVWSQVDCARISFRYEGLTQRAEIAVSSVGNNANHVLWVRSPDRWPFPANAIAVTQLTWVPDTGALVDADLAFRDFGIKWSTTEVPQEGHHDLLNTAVHEIGHFLGLDHSTVPSATMFAEAPIGEMQKRDLASDDREGVCFLYPSNPSPFQWTVTSSKSGLTTCDAGNSEPTGGTAGGCQLGTDGTVGWSWLWTLLIFSFLWYLCSLSYHRVQRS